MNNKMNEVSALLLRRISYDLNIASIKIRIVLWLSITLELIGEALKFLFT